MGEGAAEGEAKWLMVLLMVVLGCATGAAASCAPTAAGCAVAAKGVIDLGERLRLLRLQLTDSIGLKHCASGLKVLVTSRSAEFSSCGSLLSLNST